MTPKEFEKWLGKRLDLTHKLAYGFGEDRDSLIQCDVYDEVLKKFRQVKWEGK